MLGHRFRVLATIILVGCSDPMQPAEPTMVTLAASVVFAVPDESQGAPFYAISANGGFIPHDADWAALPFHRQIGCVPAAANLLAIVGPSAWSCTLTVSGHEHWENGPPTDLAPRQTVMHGLGAVPIVFARWSEVQAAIADNLLTKTELLGLSTAIVGSASSYKEIDIFGISGPLGAGRGMYKITAKGTLSDGRSFDLTVNEVLGSQQVVNITFE